MAKSDLLQFTPQGMYCAAGDFYIDPWKQVDKAVITHAHADHARWGMGAYLAHEHAESVLRLRLGKDIALQTAAYEAPLHINGVEVSFHPAGHIIGSAQVRVAYKGEVWVASGDYKVEDDGITPPFSPVQCHTFISETTFGLPVYHWQPQEEVFAEIHDWWRSNAAAGKPSVIMVYSLGKAQRLLAHLDTSIGPIFAHGAVANVTDALVEDGWDFQPYTRITAAHKKSDFTQSIILAPGSAIATPWAKKLGPFSLGIASGWMRLRGARRRRAADRGFVLSDHADWVGLNSAIKATGAERVILTHGYTEIFAKWLAEQGYRTDIEQTAFATDDGEEAGEDGKIEI